MRSPSGWPQVTATGGRNGSIRSDDGLLDLKLAMPRTLGGKGDATNPEQLFAGGYSACFENALLRVGPRGSPPFRRYITYRLAREGGKETLERKLSKDKADKLYKKFERWGFWAVTLPAILPPPFPIVPALLAAGAMQYSRKKFLGALAVGRGIRFTIVAFLGERYGRHIVRFFSSYYKPALIILIGLALIGGIVALVEYLRFRSHKEDKHSERVASHKTA